MWGTVHQTLRTWDTQNTAVMLINLGRRLCQGTTLHIEKQKSVTLHPSIQGDIWDVLKPLAACCLEGSFHMPKACCPEVPPE